APYESLESHLGNPKNQISAKVVLKWLIKIVRGTNEAIGFISAATWLGLVPAQLATFEDVRKAIEDRIVAEMTVTGEGEEEKIDLTQMLYIDRLRWPGPFGGSASPSINGITIEERPRYHWPPPATKQPLSPPDEESTELLGVVARTRAGELRFFSDDARLFAAEFVDPLLSKIAP
ncbi:hypothetical protein, partial [Parvularcula marina]